MKKKWLITLVGLTLALAAITGAGFALGGDGSDNGKPDPSGDQPTATNIDDIDPNECNWIHNIDACEGEPGPGIANDEPYPLPVGKECGPMASVAITSDGQVSCLDLGDGADMPDQEPGGQVVEPQPPVTTMTNIYDGYAPADIPVDAYMGVLWLARQDLSQRLGIEIASIKLAEIERAGWPVYWPEEPEPGVAYIDIALGGFRMVLEADGQNYKYETDASERVVFVG